MIPVYVAGRALVSSLGRNLEQALANLHRATWQQPATYFLGGGCELPYMRIPDPDQSPDWDSRARSWVMQVAVDVGASKAQDGALFIGTSCLDGATVEHAQRDMDFHALSRRIGAWLGWRGPVFLVSSACTSGLQALLTAGEWLRAGNATEALVLGLELDNRLTLPGFASLQLLSSSHARPFGLQRDGLVLGEAVAALRLTTEQAAPWQLLGGANVVDGSQPTSASAVAVTQMCQQALAASGRSSADVDLIKVQAAGSPGNDASEAAGLREAFDRLPPLISLKPLIGHCLGASGVAEIALLLESLERGYWPRYSDPVDTSLGVQLATCAPLQLRCLLASILGFGGSHTAVILEQARA